MAKNLVIVESPAKAKTINKILGKEYVVRASMGHVRDLPEKRLGVDVAENFKPEYVAIKGRKKLITELFAEATKADAIYLAPDPDREGEAIAWHLMHLLIDKKIDKEKFFRVTYNEITASAIREAFKAPSRIDQDRVDSQQARRILDRIVGYQVSPLLWRRIRGSKSAGRVQSVALRLVCEREREIENFNPEEYWLFGAKVRKQVDPKDPFSIKLAKIDGEKPDLNSEAKVLAAQEDLTDRKFQVSAVVERKLTRKAQPPYITSTLQQAGSRFFSFSPSRTMSIAQKLYEGMDFGGGPTGLITYMRTDSVSISKEARESAASYIAETFGKDYVPSKPNVYKSRGSAQEAHEAIRPTDVKRTPDELKSVLKPEELKLYRVIWERFVASQMAPAKIAQRTVEIDALPTEQKKTPYLFRVSTSDVVFPGYMKVTGQEKKKPKEGEEGEEAEDLPMMKEGEALDHIDWLQEQKFTQPPARFTEASLVRAMEENGVGRPSTYAQVLSTLQSREYVDKEKRSLKPTDLGFKVCDFLVGHLNDLFNVQFTANMEESLDDIERGKVEWTSMLNTFYGSFQDWVEKVKGPAADPELIGRFLAALKQVQDWAPATKRGKRTYSDDNFVESVKKQLEKGEKPISSRQAEALVKLLAKYKDQIEDVSEWVAAAQLQELYAKELAPKEQPRESTFKKFELLNGVSFDEPRKVGKRTYDDEKFSTSLREQAEGGKRLSDNQLKYVDRLLVKYSEQIQNFDVLAKELEIGVGEGEEDNESGPLFELLLQIQEWNPPMKRGKREWDDKKFFDSLHQQFKTKKSLSLRQRASLKKMCGRYCDQIADYDRLIEQHGLPPRREKKAKKGEVKEAADA